MATVRKPEPMGCHPGVLEDDVPDLVARLHRAAGQTNAVARMVEAKRDCREVVHQLVAARRALDRVSFKVIESTMMRCLADPHITNEDRKELERLFLSLS